MDLQANNLVTLPEDIGKFENLEELNLSSNQFTSSSSLVNPALLFKAISQIPKLKRLNVARNKFTALHSDMLNKEQDFLQLQDLDFGYNLVEHEEGLTFTTQIRHMNVLTITGNPLGLAGPSQYKNLENVIVNVLAATLINEKIN